MPADANAQVQAGDGLPFRALCEEWECSCCALSASVISLRQSLATMSHHCPGVPERRALALLRSLKSRKTLGAANARAGFALGAAAAQRQSFTKQSLPQHGACV